jgi:hypothetical protein
LFQRMATSAYGHSHHTGNEGHGAHDSVSCVSGFENSKYARDRVVCSGGSVQGVLPKSYILEIILNVR